MRRFPECRIDHERDAPETRTHAGDHGDFDGSRARRVVRGVGEQRLGLRPSNIAKSPHDRVAPRFESTTIEHAAHLHREVSRSVAQLGQHAHAENGERGHTEWTAFDDGECDIDHSRSTDPHDGVGLHVGEPATTVQRLQAPDISRELDGIETATLPHHRQTGKR